MSYYCILGACLLTIWVGMGRFHNIALSIFSPICVFKENKCINYGRYLYKSSLCIHRYNRHIHYIFPIICFSKLRIWGQFCDRVSVWSLADEKQSFDSLQLPSSWSVEVSFNAFPLKSNHLRVNKLSQYTEIS